MNAPIDPFIPPPSRSTPDRLGSGFRRIAVCATILLCLTFTGHSEVVDSAPPDGSLTIRVFDYAGLDPETVQSASQRAASMFLRAGIATAWENCRTNHPASTAPKCPLTSDPAVLSLRILSQVIPIEGLSADTIYGFAFPPGKNGFATVACVFWPRVQETLRQKRMDPGPLLGAIFVHEAGHLLLGEGSHFPIGVMKAVWADAELLQVSQNAMAFRPEQGPALRSAVDRRGSTARPHDRRVQLAVVLKPW